MVYVCRSASVVRKRGKMEFSKFQRKYSSHRACAPTILAGREIVRLHNAQHYASVVENNILSESNVEIRSSDSDTFRFVQASPGGGGGKGVNILLPQGDGLKSNAPLDSRKTLGINKTSTAKLLDVFQLVAVRKTTMPQHAVGFSPIYVLFDLAEL